VLKSRVVAGNPPSAAQIKGPAIQEVFSLNKGSIPAPQLSAQPGDNVGLKVQAEHANWFDEQSGERV
jgi:hypothetical protein